MTQEAETLTQLVSERVGEGREITYRAFETRAIDPDSGYKPSRSTIWKIAKGEPIKISPEIVRAAAAGLGLPEARVQAAAALQYIGFVASNDPGGGVAVHEPGVVAPGSRAREVFDRWEAEGHPQPDKIETVCDESNT